MASNNTNGSNIRASITTTDINCNIDRARTNFVLSKDAAGKAAAYAYVVWADTCGPQAHIDNVSWIADEIAKRNEAIKAHNKEQLDLKIRASKFVKGTLPDDDRLNMKGANAEEEKALEAERQELLALHNRTKEEWASYRKVLVEGRDGASPFTQIVKFVFGFDRPADASLTARYAKVLEWIHERFAGERINAADDLADAIKAAGGFEDVLSVQRGNVTEDDTEAKDAEAIAEAILKNAKQTALSAPSMAHFNLNVKDAPNGFVTLLGRYVDGKVEIVGEVPSEVADVEKVLVKYDAAATSPTNDHADFIARVWELGQLVGEGKLTEVTEDGTVSGKKLAEQRVLSLLPNKDAGLELMVSARLAEASVIVKATPRLERVILGEAASPMMMPHLQGRALAKMLDNKAVRRLVTVNPKMENNNLSWVAHNKALADIQSANAIREFSCSDLIDEAHRPLDVLQFRAQFAVQVSVADFAGLYRDRLVDWSESKAANKNERQTTLTFRDNTMTWSFEGRDNYTVLSAGKNPSVVAMTFRSRDVHDLVKVLTKQQVASFTIKGDSSGLLMVTWSDQLGHYSVYLPTATKTNTLEHRCVAPYQFLLEEALAA